MTRDGTGPRDLAHAVAKTLADTAALSIVILVHGGVGSPAGGFEIDVSCQGGIIIGISEQHVNADAARLRAFGDAVREAITTAAELLKRADDDGPIVWSDDEPKGSN